MRKKRILRLIVLFSILSGGILNFFSTACSRLDSWRKWLAQESQGTLVAAIGMSMDDIRKQSTLPLKGSYYRNYEWMKNSNPRDYLLTSTPDGTFFDLEIAGTGLKFQKCAYYWLQTGEKDNPRLAFMSIGLSPHKLTLDQVQAEMKETERKLREDGWSPQEFGQWRKGDVTARFYSKEYEVRTYFEKPVEGPNYFQVLELKWAK